MPVTLYHGPAGPRKRERLLRVAVETLRAGEKFLFVTGNDALATRLKSELTALSPRRLLTGSRVTTFDELFLRLVKLNRHRAHIADKDVRLALLLVTAAQVWPAAISQPEALGRRLEQWLSFCDALKSCGVGPDKARRLLGRHVEDERLFDLFSAFQTRLEELRDYDASGLALAVLEDLREGRLKWFPDVERVVITDAYPLHAGHREFLRLMKKRHPSVEFALFYDEDFARADDLLAVAYEELGELCDVSEHVEGDLAPLTVRVHASPEEEAFHVAREIRERLNAGLPAHGAAIAIAPSSAFLYEAALTRHGVPYSTHLPLKVKDHLSEGFSQASTREKVLARLATLARRGNREAIRKLQAATAWERHEASLDFVRSVLGEDLRRLSTACERALTEHVAMRLTFVPAREPHDVVLTGLGGLAPYSLRHVFITGLYAENVPIRGDDGLYSPSLKVRREFAELLRSPGYEYRVSLERIRQTIQNSTTASLSRPLADGAGRSVTRIPFERPVLRELRMESPPPPAVPYAIRRFPAHAQATFSVTNIEKYLSCPYKYYASEVLDLGSAERDSFEPGGDVRGHFIHEALRKLAEERREEYVAALTDPSRLPGFLETARACVHQVAEESEALTEFDPVAIANETERAARAVANLLRFEAEEFRKGTKVTIPARAEWTLGDGRRAGYALSTPAGEVTLTGRIDRVDYSAEAKCYSVVDYKTGEPASTKALSEALSVQITLYLMAVGELLYPGAKPSGAFLYGLKKRNIAGIALKGSPDAKFVRTRFKPASHEWEDLKDRVRSAVGTAITGIRTGRFGATPSDPSQCAFCDYRRICGRRANGGDDGTES